jgi:putative membrane protein
MTQRLAALLAAAAVAGCGPHPASDQPQAVRHGQAPGSAAAVAPPPSAPPADAQAFVDRAAAADAFELQAAKLALQRSREPRVRAFAGMMARDHTRSSDELAKAISESGETLVPAAALPADAQKLVLELTTVDQTAFDKTSVRTQIDAHEKALQTLQGYSETGEVPSLKAFATNATGAVQAHYEAARRLQQELESR